jgi:hypothetical protein
MKISSWAGALVLGCVLAGCAGDRDADEFRREKLAEQVSRMRPVVGTWRGPVYLSSDQSLLGALTLEARAGTRSGGRRDGFEAEEYPELRGKVIFEDLSGASTMEFQDAFFDSVTGSFRVTIPVQIRPDRPALELNFQGVVRGNQFSGIVEAGREDKTAGSFTLTKNGGAVETSGLSRRLGLRVGDPLQYESFVGCTYNDFLKRTEAMVLNVNPRTSRTEVRFANLISPIKFVQASVYFGLKEEEPANPVSFSNIEWDERYGKLLGSEGRAGSVLDCTWVSKEERFDCEYTVTNRGTRVFVQLSPAGRRSSCQ